MNQMMSIRDRSCAAQGIRKVGWHEQKDQSLKTACAGEHRSSSERHTGRRHAHSVYSPKQPDQCTGTVD